MSKFFIYIFFVIISFNYLEASNNSLLKKKIAEDIFKNIVSYIDSSDKQPKFCFLKSNSENLDVECRNLGAWFCDKNQTIYLREWLFDIANKYGTDRDNALSFIIGHELAHYYKHYLKGKLISLKYHGIAYSKAYEEFTGDFISIEKEADLIGSMYSYMAGYDTRKIRESFFDDIYEKIARRKDSIQKFDKSLINSGYYSLEERKILSNWVVDSLNKLIAIFDAGKMLHITGNYEDAIKCLEHISYYFPSKDIFNNIGCCYAELAFLNSDNNIQRFLYPFTFEEKSIIEKRITPKAPLQKKYIDSSRKYFKKSLGTDTNYFIAKINFACLYILERRYGVAKTYLNRIKDGIFDSKNKKLIADWNIAMGIETYLYEKKSGKKKKNTPSNYFQKAMQGNKFLAEYNLISIGKKKKTKKNKTNKLKIKEERICETGITTEVNINIEVIDTVFIKGFYFTEFYSSESCSAFRLHRNQENNKNVEYYYVLSNDKYKGESKKGLKIGDKISKVTDSLGSPNYLKTSRNFNYLIYFKDIIIKKEKFKRGLVFKISKDTDKLCGWCIFERYEG